ncbi:IS66 family insertion sequence element accessory protein TnpA [Cohnella soli]|uniref:PIN domain-containing protein n=1 Tax=Cohnella soli TaxID=425005 RepID=A0ABW0HV72_9BACL
MEKKQQGQATSWSERIATYEAGGLTMAAWSAKEGFTIHQLKYWLKRYRTTQPKPRLDTNALIRALDKGEVQAIDNAIAGRTPVVSITAAKVYLSKGDVNVLRQFLSQRGGRIGSAATEQEIQQLISQAKVLGRILKSSDASVAGSAIKEGATLITNDARFAKFLQQAGFKVEGH